MDGWMDGLMDGWVDGCMDGCNRCADVTDMLSNLGW